MPSLILLKRDRKRESSFFLFAVISQKPIRKTSRRGRPARKKKLSLLGPQRSPELMAAWWSDRYLIKQEKGRKLSRQ